MREDPREQPQLPPHASESGRHSAPPGARRGENHRGLLRRQWRRVQDGRQLDWPLGPQGSAAKVDWEDYLLASEFTISTLFVIFYFCYVTSLNFCQRQLRMKAC